MATEAAPLQQKIYVSALSGTDDTVLPDILRASQKNNERNGVTGMLLYADGNFLQVLEGPPQTVEETFARIEQDPRHHHIIVMSDEPTTQRDFADWSMGLQRLGAEEAERFPEHARWFRYGFDADAIQAQPGMALDLLKLFAHGKL
jgi:hypothetical protein